MSEPKPLGDEIGVMLLLYSEWLDASTNLMKTPRQSGDARTHAELVRDFMNGGAMSRLKYHK